MNVDRRFEADHRRFEATEQQFKSIDQRLEDLIGHLNNRFTMLTWMVGVVTSLTMVFALLAYSPHPSKPFSSLRHLMDRMQEGWELAVRSDDALIELANNGTGPISIEGSAQSVVAQTFAGDVTIVGPVDIVEFEVNLPRITAFGPTSHEFRVGAGIARVILEFSGLARSGETGDPSGPGIVRRTFASSRRVAP